MKRTWKLFIVLLAAVLCLSLGLFAAACGDKDDGGSGSGGVVDGGGPSGGGSGNEGDSGNEGGPGGGTEQTKVTLTLDFDGGTFEGAQSKTLSLEEGANVLSAVSSIVPQKGSLTFGAWFIGDTELDASYTMGKTALNLVAHYLADYKIEVRLQNVAGTSYAADSAKSVSQKAYVGSVVTPEPPEIEHFTYTAVPGAIEPITISENSSENVAVAYYDRDRYLVAYDAGEPAGHASGEIASQLVAYEGSVRAAQNAFTLSGYRFAGWSTRAGGEVEYAPDARVRVTAPVTLYAVWDRGYTDRFGGADLIFFPRGAENTAILLRGGHEFEGTRTGNDFEFDRPAGKLTGSVFGVTFSYKHDDIAGTYYLYDCTNHPILGLGGKEPDDASRLNEKTTLVVDEYLNAVYTVNNAQESGVITQSERGDYLFTGDNGTNFNFSLQKGDGAEEGILSRPRFVISGKEANAYIEALLLGGQLYLSGGSLLLDGYGNAVLYVASGMYNLGYDGYYAITNKIEAQGLTMYRVQVSIYDPLGALGGEEGAWYDNILYTVPSMVENEMGRADGYVSADVYYGEYHGKADADGATLTLDGIGAFDDSAVYTPANGKAVKGTYTYTVDRRSGLIVTVDGEGGKLVFKADPYAKTFEPYTEGGERYIELYRATTLLDYPMIYLYPDTKYGSGYKAEIYLAEEQTDQLYLAGTGYYTTQSIGGMEFYNFVLADTVEGCEGKVPTSLRFFLSAVNSVEDNLPRAVYCVLEEGGQKVYTEYKEANGVTIWASHEVSLQGVGSLMLKDGKYIEGSAEVVHSANFGTDTLIFLYADDQGRVVELRYAVVASNALTPAAGSELTLYYYLFLEDEQRGIYVQDLVLDGSVSGEDTEAVGRARFHDGYGDDDEGSWQSGTYRLVGNTAFGDNIYELTVGGVVRFRFVLYRIQNDNVYFRYDEALDGTFTAENGDEIKLDGFFYGSYEAHGTERVFGTYSFNPTESLLFVTLETGDGFYCKIEGKKFTVLDEAFGSYYLIDNNYNFINNATISFDGLGNVTVTFAGGQPTRTGTYRSYNAATYEYIVDCNFGEGMEMPQGGWHVRLLFSQYADGCIVFEPDLNGTFYNDEWDVLYLDGFGTGALYTADGEHSGSGEYTVMDEENGFMYFTFDDNSDVSICFDRANKTFSVLDFSKINYLYLSDGFDYIAFVPNGVLRVGSLSGMYFYKGDVYYGYLYDYDTDRYIAVTLPAPGANSIEYDGTAYTLWNGRALSLDGKVEFYDKEGQLIAPNGTMDATISVMPTVGANYDIPVTVTANEKSYAFTLNLYTSGKLAPRLTYDGIDYSVTFTLGSENKFTVKAGYYAIVMNDFYSNFREETGAKRGGKIVKEVSGFGPIELNPPVYSGEFYYHNNATAGADAQKITFSNVSAEQLIQVGFRVGGLGECYEILFESNGTKYAIDFYESFAEEQGPVIVLQGFFTYEEFEVEGYKVRVKYLVAATTPNTAGYSDASAIGKPYSVTLYRGTEETPVLCYDTGVSVNRDAVWLGEYKGVSESDTVIVGKGYYVKFTFEGDTDKVTAVEVKEYTIGQVVTGAYLVNFFIEGEKGAEKVAQVIAVAYSDGSGYYWLDNTHDLTYDEETDTWTFYGTPGASTEVQYTLKFSKTETGNFIVTVTHS